VNVFLKPSMGAESPAGPHDPKRVQMLDGTLYLFKYLAEGYAPRLIISAHGAQGASPAKFPLEADEHLYFYSAHGEPAPSRAVFSAAGMREPTEGPVDPQGDLAGPAECHNYRLKKYQGIYSPGVGETYDQLQRMQETDATTYKKMFRNPHNLRKEQSTVLPGDYLKDLPLPTVRDPLQFDILTVRNRWYSQTVTLAEVMKALRKLPHRYEEIHCTFCRSESGA
jgi:hypothetical protein